VGVQSCLLSGPNNPYGPETSPLCDTALFVQGRPFQAGPFVPSGLYLCIRMNQKPSLFTVVSPRLLDIYDISNSIVVVIDVFRATSTIATALYNGATRVIPVDSVDKCIQILKLCALPNRYRSDIDELVCLAKLLSCGYKQNFHSLFVSDFQ